MFWGGWISCSFRSVMSMGLFCLSTHETSVQWTRRRLLLSHVSTICSFIIVVRYFQKEGPIEIARCADRTLRLPYSLVQNRWCRDPRDSLPIRADRIIRDDCSRWCVFWPKGSRGILLPMLGSLRQTPRWRSKSPVCLQRRGAAPLLRAHTSEIFSPVS